MNAPSNHISFVFFSQDVEIEGNPNIKSVHEHGYVLKVMNSADSNAPGVVRDQNVLLENLGRFRILVS